MQWISHIEKRAHNNLSVFWLDFGPRDNNAVIYRFLVFSSFLRLRRPRYLSGAAHFSLFYSSCSLIFRLDAPAQRVRALVMLILRDLLNVYKFIRRQQLQIHPLSWLQFKNKSAVVENIAESEWQENLEVSSIKIGYFCKNGKKKLKLMKKTLKFFFKNARNFYKEKKLNDWWLIDNILTRILTNFIFNLKKTKKN